MSINDFVPIFTDRARLKNLSDILVSKKLLPNSDWSKTSNLFKLIRHKMQLTCSCCGAKAKYFGVAEVKNSVNALPVIVAQKSTGQFVKLTFDHIIPKSLGGSYNNHNGDVLCGDCNVKKSNEFSIMQMIEVLSNENYLKMIGYSTESTALQVFTHNALKNGPIKVSALQAS